MALDNFLNLSVCWVPTIAIGAVGCVSTKAIAIAARSTDSLCPNSSRSSTNSGLIPSPVANLPPASGLQARGIMSFPEHWSRVPSLNGLRQLIENSGCVVTSGALRNEDKAEI